MKKYYNNESIVWRSYRTFYGLYYTHFKITGDPWNLIGSQQCDLFTNCTIFGSKSHPFLARQNENEILKIKN